jgi:hypothetical protein
LYSSIVGHGRKEANLLSEAVSRLLQNIDEQAQVLLSMAYCQNHYDPKVEASASVGGEALGKSQSRIVRFPSPDMGLVLQDNILDHVKWMWEQVLGNNAADEPSQEVEDSIDCTLWYSRSAKKWVTMKASNVMSAVAPKLYYDRMSH